MANRYFNKQTTNARQALAEGGPAADPRRKLGPRKPKTGRPSIPEFPRQPSPGPKGGLEKLKPFDNTDKTDRKKIIKDRIRRNKIKDRLDKLKEKMKPGLDPKSPKLKQLQEQMKKFKSSKIGDQMAKKQRQADYMKKHGKKAPRRKTLSVTNSYKKEVEGLK